MMDRAEVRINKEEAVAEEEAVEEVLNLNGSPIPAPLASFARKQIIHLQIVSIDANGAKLPTTHNGTVGIKKETEMKQIFQRKMKKSKYFSLA